MCEVLCYGGLVPVPGAAGHHQPAHADHHLDISTVYYIIYTYLHYLHISMTITSGTLRMEAREVVGVTAAS